MDAKRQHEVSAILARCDGGTLSPAVALMEMIIATEDPALVRRWLEEEAGASANAEAIARLIENNDAGCARIAAMLRSGVDSPPQNPTIEEGIAFCRTLFDWSVTQCEEASVALYSLGNPAILSEATREIVALLTAWGVLGAATRVLDVGCGIGRIEQALAPHVGEIRGIDVSPEMVAVARRRCQGLSNVRIDVCSGKDYGDVEAGAVDLIVAVDSFPYLVQTGLALVATQFVEAHRVLRAGGDFVVLNFSYREDLAADARDVRELAKRVGLDVLVAGEQPFRLWNGTAFRLRKP